MSINDEAGVGVEVKESMDKTVESVIREDEQQGGGFQLPEWLFLPRLEEPIEGYVNHPFNFQRSEGVAYIIRGLSAVFSGALNYWWTDVIGGVLRIRMEGKANVVQTSERATTTGPQA